ncbi:hypothetical protein BC938DRAFT_478232, partial [Jimgerdemannia flammicorona]
LKLSVSPPEQFFHSRSPKLTIAMPTLHIDTTTTPPTIPTKSPPTPSNQFMSTFPLYKFSISPPSASSLSLRSLFSTSPPTKPKQDIAPASPPPIAPTTHLFTFLDDIRPVVVSEARSPHTTDSTTSTLSDLLRAHYVATQVQNQQTSPDPNTSNTIRPSDPIATPTRNPIPLKTFKYSEIPVADADPYGYDSYDLDSTSDDEDDDSYSAPSLSPSSSVSSLGSSFFSSPADPKQPIFRPFAPRLPTPHRALRSQQHHHHVAQRPAKPAAAVAPSAPPAPARYVRDVRGNPAHLRMITAEMNMMRSRKIVSPLKPRGWLPRRGDHFVKGKRSALRCVELAMEA